MIDDFILKVALIAEAKYGIESDILEAYKAEIEQCYEHDFSVRKTVELLATLIFN